jgi:hypothetical protein
MRTLKKTTLLLTLAAASLFTTGCAVTVPAMAKTERGEQFIGNTTATPFGGTYVMHSPEGKSIRGTYNPWDRSTTRVFEFQISDGRTGRAIVNATSDTSGYGIGKLSTGEKCEMFYGNVPMVRSF